jgi:hypothetical protein
MAVFWTFVYKTFELLLQKKVKVPQLGVDYGNQYTWVCWLEEEPLKSHQCGEPLDPWPHGTEFRGYSFGSRPSYQTQHCWSWAGVASERSLGRPGLRLYDPN